MKFHIDKTVKVGRLWSTVDLNYGITLGVGDDGKMSRISVLTRGPGSHKLNSMVHRMHIDKPQLAAFVIKELMSVLTPIRNALNREHDVLEAVDRVVQGACSGAHSRPGDWREGNMITLRSFDRYIKKRRKRE